jgi:hypothetical protein
VQEAIDLFALQIPPVAYSTVHATRLRWSKQREQYSIRVTSPETTRYRTHFYTVASHNNTELQNLEFTARLAGVELKVLGIGKEYTSWLQKLEWYVETLLDDSNNDIADDDIVVMMDAYDVLLSPMIRRLGEHVSNSPTPLVACAENGQYPEPEAPWFYPRGTYHAFPPREMGQAYGSDSDAESLRRMGGATRFLNSGCVAGRAQDIKDFLRTIYHEMTLVRDDQQVYVRHFLRNPHMISIDVEMYNQGKQQSSMFQCGWRVSVGAFTELAHTGVARFYGAYLPVGLFHMNNRQSEPLYKALASMYRQLHDTCFAGRRGPQLLEAVHMLVDRKQDEAELLLASLVLEDDNDGFLLTAAERACLVSIARGTGLPEISPPTLL